MSSSALSSSDLPILPDSHLLLEWYDKNGRTLPWRAEKKACSDPYHVWLSEIMLQQTGVKTVISYYHKFLDKWPTLKAFSEASEDDVMRHWAGLGYYARARNLLKCAQAVQALGGFPKTPQALQKLPGIGPYTANAIAAMAFNQPYVAIDGNVERIAARFFAIEAPLPASRPELHTFAEKLNLTPAAQQRPSDFMQALFDLGSLICTPRSPACLSCPWQHNCQGFKQNKAASLPKRSPKPKNPEKYGAVFLLENEAGQIWLQKRPSKGLLGGTMEMPGTEWTLTPPSEETLLQAAPLTGEWEKLPAVKHVFTHFTLYLTPYLLKKPAFKKNSQPLSEGGWEDMKQAALSTLMKKAYGQFRPFKNK